MRPVIIRVLCLTAPGAALALLGLTGVTAPAGAAGVAGTTLPPVTVYVASSISGTVTPIRVATNRPGRAINTHGANTLTATPDGRTVYVVSRSPVINTSPGIVTPISTRTGKAGAPIQVGSIPEYNQSAITIMPNGRTAYVATASGVTPCTAD